MFILKKNKQTLQQPVWLSTLCVQGISLVASALEKSAIC